MDHSSDVLPAAFNRTLQENLGERAENCDAHGAYVSAGMRYLGRREVWTPCPGCEEARVAGERRADAMRMADAQRERIEAMVGAAAIPGRFVGRSLENFHAVTDAQQEALRIATDYAANFSAHAKRGRSLIFSGLPGTGKSHLATAILQALMPERCGLYTVCMDVIRNVRATWRRDSEHRESEVLGAYTTVPLLVLDEIGAQYGTDGEQTILFDVLDRRYRDMRPSILLTNQDKAGMKQFIGERTFDRLTETARWVSFDWESYRPQARKEGA